MRGRRRKSSGGRISCQNSSTGLTLVKNRCPPMSKRQPSRSTVRLMPPTTLSCSTMTTGSQASASRYAAVSPAGPPPPGDPERAPEAAAMPSAPASSGLATRSLVDATRCDPFSLVCGGPGDTLGARARCAVAQSIVVPTLLSCCAAVVLCCSDRCCSDRCCSGWPLLPAGHAHPRTPRPDLPPPCHRIGDLGARTGRSDRSRVRERLPDPASRRGRPGRGTRLPRVRDGGPPDEDASGDALRW